MIFIKSKYVNDCKIFAVIFFGLWDAINVPHILKYRIFFHQQGNYAGVHNATSLLDLITFSRIFLPLSASFVARTSCVKERWVKRQLISLLVEF